MTARKPATVPDKARPGDELVELTPEDEAELERAIDEAAEAQRNGTLVPWETYFAEQRRRVG